MSRISVWLCISCLSVISAFVSVHVIGAAAAPEAPDGKRQAVPGAADQAKAERLVRQLFASDYAKRTADDKRALARKLLDSAADAKDDLVGRYVLLREARDLATASGDFKTALEAIDALGVSFIVDANQLKLAALSTIDHVLYSTPNEEFAQACLDLGHRCFESGEFDNAARLALLAENVARRAKNSSILDDAHEMGPESRRLSTAASRLAKNADDSFAATAMGSWLCFGHNDWAKGLPMLSRGSDKALSSVAARDLKMPTTPDDEFEVANGWWDVAQKQPSVYRNGAEARAAQWYRAALPGLKALSKAIAEKRMGRELGATASDTSGAVVKPRRQGAEHSNGPDLSPPKKGPPEAITNLLGMRLVPIPLDPRGFDMGSPVSEKGRRSNETLHHVKLTRPFLMAAKPVTVAQFTQFTRDAAYETRAELFQQDLREGRIKAADIDPHIDFVHHVNGRVTGINWRIPSFDQQDDSPVVMLAIEDAEAFCEWLSKKEGRHYRLPTEAEWEYAARAGTKTAYFWGDDPDQVKEYANCADLALRARFPDAEIFNVNDGFGATSPVGSFKANAFGLYDMIGNVSQWVSDYYQPYPTGETIDPQVVAGEAGARIARGGAWDSGPAEARIAARHKERVINPTNRSGMRVCLDP